MGAARRKRQSREAASSSKAQGSGECETRSTKDLRGVPDCSVRSPRRIGKADSSESASRVKGLVQKNLNHNQRPPLDLLSGGSEKSARPPQAPAIAGLEGDERSWDRRH